MDIKALPRGIKKVYKHPDREYGTALKPVSDDDLVSALKKIVKKTDKKESKIWILASAIFNELVTRNYYKKHPGIVDKLGNKLEKKSKLCVVDPVYGLESGGISDHKKVIHPYPYSEVGRKIKDKWQHSHSGKDMDDYVDYFSKETRKDLKKASVTYLKPSERDKYLVTFIHKKKILIGGKAPKDGKYIYALSADGKMLLAAKKIKGKIQHTSFFGGRAVACAGVFDIQKQQLKKATLASGHYKPDAENGKNLRKFLKQSKNLGKNADNLPITAHSKDKK